MFKISIQAEEIEKLPLGAFPGKIIVIDKMGVEYAKAVAYLLRQKVIGFDTETRPVFTPGHPHHHQALLQLSGPDRAYLFRMNKMGLRKLLSKVLACPSIIKVGAAVHDDIRGLQYHRSFKPKGFVDLQKIVYQWGIRDKSVKKMAAIILGCRISKTQQLSNWEAENLSQAQKMYAATDAWICREMYMKLLSSEKHPLTPEQMMPQNPAASKQPVQNAPANVEEKKEDKPKAATKKHTHRRRKAKSKTADAPAETPAVKQSTAVQAGEKAPAKRRKPHHRRKKTVTNQSENGKNNPEKRS